MACTCRKAGYVSEAQARSEARRLSQGFGPKRTAYRCPGDPKLWHMGSQGPRPWKRKIK